MASRRRFVKQACGAVVLTELVTLGGCRPSVHDLGDDDDDDLVSPEVTVTPVDNLIEFPLADFPLLQSVNGTASAYVKAAALSVYVVRVTDTQFVAIDMTCTHSSCSVLFDSTNDDFRCTCHNGRFDLTGAVTMGPPPAPLTVFPVTFDGSVVTVDISGA